MKFRFSLLCLLVVAGCTRTGDMYETPRYEPYESSTLFPDSRSARMPVPGTVARGQLKANAHLHQGKVKGVDATSYPFPITAKDLSRGRERYQIHCAPCHASTGAGNGMIVQRGFQKPPSFHDESIVSRTEGHLFQVITNGYGVMPPYAAALDAQDRWRIVAYLRALQLSRRVPYASLSPEAQQKVREKK